MVSKNKFLLDIRSFSKYTPFKFDELVKSRHSREGGNPCAHNVLKRMDSQLRTSGMTVMKRTFCDVVKFINFILLIIFIASCSTPYRSPSGYAVASWYGFEFHGKPTASGEIFNMYGYTCAHKEYPFGTKLKVTNTINDKSIACVVNDRGPFVQGRDVDLSYAAAKDIELIETGTATVRIDKLGRDISYIREVKYLSDSGPFTIQVGSFRDASNASRLKTGLELKYDKVYITEAEINGERFYRVRIGKFQARNEVQKLGRTLADEGYNVFITDHEEKI